MSVGSGFSSRGGVAGGVVFSSFLFDVCVYNGGPLNGIFCIVLCG